MADDLIRTQKPISPELARYLLSMEFGESDRERIEYLAGRCCAGTLTAAAETEYDSYLHVGNVLAVIQSKARVVLGIKLPTHS